MKSETLKYLILNKEKTYIENCIIADVDFVNRAFPDRWLRQDQYPSVGIGYVFNKETETWESPNVDELDDRLELICSEPFIECTDSKALTLDFEVQDDGKIDKDYNERFCVPIVSVDGREVLVLFEFKNGKFKLKTTMKTSGVWKITEAQVNLYSSTKFKFTGVTLLVFQE